MKRVRSLGVWAAAVALAAFALGMAVQALQAPGFTRALVTRYAMAEEAGLPAETMVVLAERVRTFVVDGSGELPARVEGREGFDAAAVSHLADVARVLDGAAVATGMLALALAVWLGVAIARRHVADVASALRRAAVVVAGFLGGALVLAALDFGSFFAAFHSLFFASGTWRFPADALLILVFPEPFWVTAGISWVLLTGLIAGAYWVSGMWLARAGARTGNESGF